MPKHIKGRFRGTDKTSTSNIDELRRSREQLDKTIRTAAEVGISYQDLLELDIRKFNEYVEGYTKRRERSINDSLTIQHIAASKIAQAVWGSKEFKRPIKEIKLTQEKDTIESRNQKVINSLKKKGII